MEYLPFDARVELPNGDVKELHADIYGESSIRTRGDGSEPTRWRLRRQDGSDVIYVPKDTLPDGCLVREGLQVRPLSSEKARPGDELWAGDKKTDELCRVGVIREILPIAMLWELGDQS